MRNISYKKSKYALLSVLSLLLVSSGVVMAENPTMSDSVSQAPLTEPADPQKGTTLEERIAQRKNAQKAAISATRKQAIVSKCVAAQKTLVTVKSKADKSAEARTEKYRKLATQISDMIVRLETQSVETTEIKTAQGKFNAAANQYLNDYANFKSMMSDLIKTNCVADPAGFDATLLSARQIRTLLVKDVSDVKAAVPEVKAALTAAKQVLASKKTGSQN